MTDLCKLAQKYDTDKYPWYTPFYDLLLNHRRQDVKRVLEIGIGTKSTMGHVADYQPGASLRMWRDYFPTAEITGLDIDTKVLFTEERIKTYYGDQGKLTDMCVYADYRAPFDLIVDDGSHDPVHQITTALRLLRFLRVGGLYIIEDVNGKLDLPFVHQYVECNVPGNSKVGRCVVICK